MSCGSKFRNLCPPLSVLLAMIVIVVTILVTGEVARSGDNESIMLLSSFNLIVTVMSGVKIISDPLDVGTRVHWDAEKQALFYVDVPNALIYKYEPGTNKTTKAKVEHPPPKACCSCPDDQFKKAPKQFRGTEPLGFAFPVANTTDEFIAALGRKFITFKWDGESENVAEISEIWEVDQDKPLNRLNGGKIDPKGRLWAGTMGETGADGNTVPGRGSLFSVTKGKVKKQETNIGISNGLAWNLKLKKMYYIDTEFLGVYQYDYDAESGNITNRQVLYKFSTDKIEGKPDGLTIDTNGNLYVAVIFGSKIIQIDPKGKLLKTFDMPTPEITAVSFGGKNLDILYVNSARMAIDGTVPEHPAGCTFSLKDVGAKGLAGDSYIK